MKQDAGLRESLGFAKPILSGKEVKTVKSEYLSRAFALDLKAMSRDTPATGALLSINTRGLDTARRRHSKSAALLNLPPWHVAPQYEGLLSLVPRGDVPLTARARLQGGFNRTSSGEGFEGAGNRGSGTFGPLATARGVVGERTAYMDTGRVQPLHMANSAKRVSLRNDMRTSDIVTKHDATQHSTALHSTTQDNSHTTQRKVSLHNVMRTSDIVTQHDITQRRTTLHSTAQDNSHTSQRKVSLRNQIRTSDIAAQQNTSRHNTTLHSTAQDKSTSDIASESEIHITAGSRRITAGSRLITAGPRRITAGSRLMTQNRLMRWL